MTESVADSIDLFLAVGGEPQSLIVNGEELAIIGGIFIDDHGKKLTFIFAWKSLSQGVVDTRYILFGVSDEVLLLKTDVESYPLAADYYFHIYFSGFIHKQTMSEDLFLKHFNATVDVAYKPADEAACVDNCVGILRQTVGDGKKIRLGPGLVAFVDRILKCAPQHFVFLFKHTVLRAELVHAFIQGVDFFAH